MALEPFGEFRADMRAALVAQTIFNMAVARKDRRPLKDFLLFKPEDDEKKGAQEQLAVIKVLAAAYADALTVAEQRGIDPDREVTAAMHEQVARARAAMKG